MNKHIADKINKSVTLNDYLKVLLDNFDCANCKPSTFIKSTIVYKLTGMLNAVSFIVNESVKQKCINSENIEQFIKIIIADFNLNANLSEAARSKLIDNTKMLITLTGLKELETTSAKITAKEIQKPELKTAPPIEKESLTDKFKKTFKRRK